MLLFEGIYCKMLYSAIFVLLLFCTNTSAEIIAEQLVACLKVNVFLPRCPSGRTCVTPQFSRCSVTHHLHTGAVLNIEATTASLYFFKVEINYPGYLTSTVFTKGNILAVFQRLDRTLVIKLRMDYSLSLLFLQKMGTNILFVQIYIQE